MTKGILDASAAIAFVRQERGFDNLRQWLPGSQISAVNYAEVLQKLTDSEQEKQLLHALMASCKITIVDFNQAQAERVAHIFPEANKGISMADRACLALGIETGLPVITADHNWQELNLHVELIMFRPKTN